MVLLTPANNMFTQSVIEKLEYYVYFSRHPISSEGEISIKRILNHPASKDVSGLWPDSRPPPTLRIGLPK